MEDVGLWQAYEAQASLQQQAAALMYNNVGPHHPDHNNNHIASVADHGGCMPQSPAFLPCWNDSSGSSCSSWLHAAARSPHEIHDMSTLMCTPSSLHLVDTGFSLNHHHQRRRGRHPSRLIQQHQQLDRSSSSSPPELSNMLCQSGAADGLWGGSHNSSSGGGSLATELYGTGPAAASAMHKLMQAAQCCYSYNRTVQGPATESMSMAAASNCALQQPPGYCNNSLQASAAHGLKPNGESAAAAAAASSYGAAAASSMQRDKKISALQAPAAAAGTSCRKAVDTSSSHSFSTVPGGMYATGGGGGGTGGRDCRLEGTNLLHQQQQQLLQLPIIPGGGGITGVMNSPACGSSSAASLGAFSPSGNGGVAAATNVAQQEIQRRVTGIAATTAAGGMKSMASFNPGPYVSSAAAGERQDSALAARRVWLENKGGSSSAPTIDFNAAQQLACGSAVQRIAGSKQQQQQQQQQPCGIKSGGGAATQVPRIEWSSRMSPVSAAAAAVAVGAVQQLGGSRVHTGLQGPVDEKTTSIVLMQQPETAATTTTTTLKCALPRCPAASSGNTAFTNPRKRSILQGDSFQGIFQDSGKKSAAAGGMLWSGQDHGCSRLEYLSTAAHKQVSQSTATSGSSRALGPALNTNLKPRARQGSANDPQSIAARVRRERISERLKYLQALIPNGDKVDMVTMLEKAINYVQCLELQIQMLKDDSLWPKALGALPNTVQELLELAGPEFSGVVAVAQSMKPDVVEECKPKPSVELMEEDPTNPPPPLIL